jgi:hypothetical protein
MQYNYIAGVEPSDALGITGAAIGVTATGLAVGADFALALFTTFFFGAAFLVAFLTIFLATFFTAFFAVFFAAFFALGLDFLATFFAFLAMVLIKV